jgi:heme/copper-type cytochrome/quinol oxidase subunit 1
MLSAKLFATLAILQIGLALLESKAAHQSIDIYSHATYIVIGRVHLQLLLATASGLSALTYFTASRWILRPLNNALGLTHFVLATIAFALLSVSLSALRSAAVSGSHEVPVPIHWLRFATLGLLCFLLGCATLAVNCGWTAITAFRLRHG